MRRLWLMLRLRFGETATAVGGLLLGVLIAAAVASFFVQIGPEEAGRNGTVVALGRVDSEGGNRAVAVVRLSSGTTLTVGLDRGEDCRIGDRIEVSFYRTLWGRWRRSGPCRR